MDYERHEKQKAGKESGAERAPKPVGSSVYGTSAKGVISVETETWGAWADAEEGQSTEEKELQYRRAFDLASPSARLLGYISALRHHAEKEIYIRTDQTGAAASRRLVDRHTPRQYWDGYMAALNDIAPAVAHALDKDEVDLARVLTNGDVNLPEVLADLIRQQLG